jgi:hypothetical protein
MKSARFRKPTRLALAWLIAAALFSTSRAFPEPSGTAPSGGYGEAFGVRLGMSKEAVRALGVKLEASGVSETWGQRYRTEELPKSFGDERWIWLYFGNDDRLFRIIAELADHGTAYDSRDALRRYKKIKENLSARYAVTSSREAIHPKEKPCFNPPSAIPYGGGPIDDAARISYQTALETGGHHKIVSMMHFCAIKNWSTEFDRTDTYVTLTVSPKDAWAGTSYAFIHLKVESKSLAENFRREKTSPLSAGRAALKPRSASLAK